METNGQEPEQIPRRERKKLQDREEIIAAASDLFSRQGYEQTSMQMIAERAELSVGKLYLHFDGKEAIYREVVEYHAALMRERLETECGSDLSPMDRIRCRMRAALCYIEDNMAFARIYLAESGRPATTCHEPDHEDYLQIMERLFGKAVERGEIPDENPRLLAALVHGAAHGLMEIALSDDSVRISDVPELIDRLVLRPLELRMDQKTEGENGR